MLHNQLVSLSGVEWSSGILFALGCVPILAMFSSFLWTLIWPHIYQPKYGQHIVTVSWTSPLLPATSLSGTAQPPWRWHLSEGQGRGSVQ